MGLSYIIWRNCHQIPLSFLIVFDILFLGILPHVYICLRQYQIFSHRVPSDIWFALLQGSRLFVVPKKTRDFWVCCPVWYQLLLWVLLIWGPFNGHFMTNRTLYRMLWIFLLLLFSSLECDLHWQLDKTHTLAGVSLPLSFVWIYILDVSLHGGGSVSKSLQINGLWLNSFTVSISWSFLLSMRLLIILFILLWVLLTFSQINFSAQTEFIWWNGLQIPKFFSVYVLQCIWHSSQYQVISDFISGAPSTCSAVEAFSQDWTDKLYVFFYLTSSWLPLSG